MKTTPCQPWQAIKPNPTEISEDRLVERDSEVKKMACIDAMIERRMMEGHQGDSGY